MMKMEPPTIYLPAEAVEDVEALLRAFQRLDRGRMPAELVGLKPGDEIELSRELVVKAFATRHTIPSLGYLVWERRKKLKPEYQDLTGEQIRDLRLSGVEVSAEIRIPKVAYLGDTSPPGLDALPEIYRAADPDPRDDVRRARRAGLGDPQVRSHPPRRPAGAGRPVRERGDHRVALQHPAPPRPDPADRREAASRVAQGAAQDLALTGWPVVPSGPPADPALEARGARSDVRTSGMSTVIRIGAARRAAYQVAAEAVGTAHREVEATDRDHGRAEDRRQGPAVHVVVGVLRRIRDKVGDGGVEQFDRVIAVGLGRALSRASRDGISAAAPFRAARPAIRPTGRSLAPAPGCPVPPGF